jgi:hypothetical protein
MIPSSNPSLLKCHHCHTSSAKSVYTNNNKDNNDIENDNTSADIDCLIQDLQPIIHYIAEFIRLIHWKSNESMYSMLLFSAWILWWTLHKLVLSSIPIILIGLKIYHELPSPLHQHTLHPEEQDNNEYYINTLLDDLTEIRDTIYLISSIKNWIQKSDTLCRAYYKYYLIASRKQRSTICFGVACLFTMIYAGWIFLLYQQIITSCASIAWFTILVIMCLNSPWVNPIYVACVRAVVPVVYYFIELTNITNTSAATTTRLHTLSQQQDNDQHYINGYCFEIYHHQRWWFPTGWSNLLLPQDRPVWYVYAYYNYKKHLILNFKINRSDKYLESTPSIDEFRLPPTTYIGKPNASNQQKIISWTWIDPTWSKHEEFTTATDKDGWQYGSWKWKSWTSQSSGLGICTRRQKWYRYAQHKESWVDVPAIVDVPEEEEEDKCCNESICSSMIGGSSTSASSSSIYEEWDSNIPPSSYSSTTTAAEESVSSSSLKPTLISNINEKSSRRLSCQSVTFNTPILSFQQQQILVQQQEQDDGKVDDMYKQFCISPIPQKLLKKCISIE